MFDALTLGLWKKMLGDSIDGLFNPRGDYNPDADPLYSKRDIVFDNGGSYRYINDTPSNEPTSSTSHWQQIAEKGLKGDIGDVTPAAISARDAATAQATLAKGYADQLAAGTASPAGAYANLTALNTDNPDHTKIYLTSNDGNWNYWNGTVFVAGGIYQATTPLAFSVDALDGGLNITYTY